MTGDRRARQAPSGLRPKDVVTRWVEAFNRADADTLGELYAEDATNHQVAETPVTGRAAIRAMFTREFAAAEMTCIVENLFEDGEWAILEWRDPKGLRGSGFFRVIDGHIVLLARERGWPILSSDPDELLAIDPSLTVERV